jgi:hypothetical protein
VKKIVTPSRASLGMSTPASRRPLHVADRHAVHALHDDHVRRAQLPHHLRYEQQVEPLHVAAQLRGVGGLAHQVELVVQVGVELGDDLARLEPLAVDEDALDPDRELAQQGEVVVDRREHAGPEHLDRDLAPVLQDGEVDLGDRGRWPPAPRRSWRRRCRSAGRRPARPVARATASGKGGTRSCSLASSSAMSAGIRSRRVDMTWPNLTKIGPSVSSPRRSARRAKP